jgi:O-antigen/teichoic acid export membrane protein
VISFLKRDFKMFSSQIFVSLQMYAPIVLISVFGTNLMAGQFKIVEQVVVIFKTYILVFFNFVYPKICYLIHSNPKKAILNWKYYNGTNFVFVTISMILVYTFSLEIITYFNSSNAYLLSKLLQIAVFYPILIAISIPLKQLVLAWNHNQSYALITTISVIVNIIAMIILIPIYKVQGVFISLIIIEAFVILFYLICIHKNWVQNISNDKEFISKTFN